MPFNPLAERGLALERQLRGCSELDVQRRDTPEVHPYTRCGVIAMNGVEVEAVGFSDNFNRNCAAGPGSDRRRPRPARRAHQEAVTLLGGHLEHSDDPKLRPVAGGALPIVERLLKALGRVATH